MKIKAIIIGISLFFAVFALLYNPAIGENGIFFSHKLSSQTQTEKNQESKNKVIGEDGSIAGQSDNIQEASETEDKNDLQNSTPEVDRENTKNNQNLVLATKVVDGDTIEITGGQKVRYIGIDTPETVHPSKPVMCFGKEASTKNRELVEGKRVRLEKDVSETDKYGRLLRYVYLSDDTFVNLLLVEEGYASSYSYPPDIKYQEQFQQAEKSARENNLGLWGSCGGTKPVNSDCNIKGNISVSGEKIYHLPGQEYYYKTVIDESKGEKWFCSEDEAIEAGWRKSKK